MCLERLDYGRLVGALSELLVYYPATVGHQETNHVSNTRTPIDMGNVDTRL